MAQIDWTLKGRILVKTQFPELANAFGKDGGPLPLEGVRVKVSAKEFAADRILSSSIQRKGASRTKCWAHKRTRLTRQALSKQVT